jgi:hypothetical protein
MSEKQLKTATDWRAVFLKDWPSRLVLTAVTAFCAYAYTHADEVVKRKILETVQPYLDTLKGGQEATDEKVEKMDDKLDALINVMGDAFPEFKKAAKERAQENRDSREVQDALTGDTP